MEPKPTKQFRITRTQTGIYSLTVNLTLQRLVQKKKDRPLEWVSIETESVYTNHSPNLHAEKQARDNLLEHQNALLAGEKELGLDSYVNAGVS